MFARILRIVEATVYGGVDKNEISKPESTVEPRIPLYMGGSKNEISIRVYSQTTHATVYAGVRNEISTRVYSHTTRTGVVV